tara:strand:+ start:49 stop:216 length:168 start_codon:yes stop_codon:yes gene_type:complete
MKIELTKTEIDLIIYALVHVSDSLDNGELKSSYISFHRGRIDDLINDVNNVLEDK